MDTASNRAARLMRPCPTRPELEELLKKAKKYCLTPQDIWDQRVSFVHGQLMNCSPATTKEDIIKAATKIYGPRPRF